MNGSETLWTQIASYGIGGVLAAIMFWFYTQREKQHKEFVTECMKEKEVLNNVLVTVVKDNTAAMTKNTTVIDALHRRLDGELKHHREDNRFSIDDKH